MAALGQKQPLNKYQILTPERPLSGHTGHSPLVPCNPEGEWPEAAMLQDQPLAC